MRASSWPRSRIASRSVVPAGSARSPSPLTSSPTNARLPNSAASKRVPSSSMNATIQIGRCGWKPSCLRQRHRVYGGDDAEHAVEAAARRHGVEMRADRDRSAAARVPAPDEIAGLVDLDLESERAHAIADPGVGREQLGRPRDARDATAGAAADLRELVEALADRARERGECLLGGGRLHHAPAPEACAVMWKRTRSPSQASCECSSGWPFGR